MSIEIGKAVLEHACKEMIETILWCLPNASKGTIYRIGRPPELIAERITSGIIDRKRGEISWGLPEKSEYNPPGKPWVEYRDEPGRPLEAMAWCVEKQKSWTSENPRTDIRSVRLQVEGVIEDFHHMEPVLVRKSDLRFNMYSSPEYPRDFQGKPIWKGHEFIVVAVIKIHFHPHTIRIGSPETVIIKKLSRSLGTQLLSYQLQQDSLKAMQQLAQDRLNACNILADSLRNAITKSGLIFSLIKQEVGHLRERWEALLLEELRKENPRTKAVRTLNQMLSALPGVDDSLRKDLAAVHGRFLELNLPPQKGENWITMQIQTRWENLFERSSVSEKEKQEALRAIEALKKSLNFGQDPEIINKINRIPSELKNECVRLIYKDMSRFQPAHLDEIVRLLENPALSIPYREKSKKTLVELKALAENMSLLERNTNFLLNQVLNGVDNKIVTISGKNRTK
ncbi:MAG: hypothetical protein JRI79_12915 [Deltaproteobacteria bacterium]|nr:hypothetical protein [Deltaproteobacteria bacterium]MBW1920342.1 hypothetical protein [Deltaproteobacteria bacterium]MBW1935591.1 hypothetical protein [Deltaproteobacteria bacterium]MBW1978849.1 hypothetical protein [Deltaproteobacteria bacterium]MBW2044658.1 hypothetical protein [Deltaproteobacteria bacterium]